MHINSKDLLKQYNQKKYQEFLLNNETQLTLSSVSRVPMVTLSERQDVYTKVYKSYNNTANNICFIKKNDENQGFIWNTTSENIKKACRYGIIKTESVVGRAIADLGKYNLRCYDERFNKGLVTNRQALKLILVEHYQERLEALEILESLVNKNNEIADYETTIAEYIQKLEKIDMAVNAINATNILISEQKAEISSNLKLAKLAAKKYFDSIDINNIDKNNNARGCDAIQEFVKQQAIFALYELQGINQNITYDKKRYFALTRGFLNDCIEDARKNIDNYDSDLLNMITPEHHGIYAVESTDRVAYDFSHLDSTEQYQVLTAISFIEEWTVFQHQYDTVNQEDKYYVMYSDPNKHNKLNLADMAIPLEIYAAANWKTQRSFKLFIKNILYFLWNIAKSFVVETHNYEIEFNKNAVLLDMQNHVKKHEPLWKKTIKFLKQLLWIFRDILYGVYNFGRQLLFKMPDILKKDWLSTKRNIVAIDYATINESLATIKMQQTDLLKQILLNKYDATEHQVTAMKLAAVAYHLTPGEQNDILTSMARGLGKFSDIFIDSIFAKNPVAGLVFTASYVIGAAIIYMPQTCAKILGDVYVNVFMNFSYAMGSSKLTAAIAGASTQSQFLTAIIDVLMHGASSASTDTLDQLARDPLTTLAYFLVAYEVGNLLINGIYGHRIPVISDILREDLGSIPETGYTLIGGKFAILTYEMFMQHASSAHGMQSQFKIMNNPQIDKHVYSLWLKLNSEFLPYLNFNQLFQIENDIDKLFDKHEALALKKLLSLKKAEPSIALQLFAIPLAYVPALIRLVIALVFSVAALQLKPIRRAGSDLLDLIKVDINRLVTFAIRMVYTVSNGISIVFKILGFIFNMLSARVGALFNVQHHIGKAFHFIAAKMHIGMRHIGEWFYPVTLAKDVAIPDPQAVLLRYSSVLPDDSYQKMQLQMSQIQLQKLQNTKKDHLEYDKHIDLSFNLSDVAKLSGDADSQYYESRDSVNVFSPSNV